MHKPGHGASPPTTPKTPKTSATAPRRTARGAWSRQSRYVARYVALRNEHTCGALLLRVPLLSRSREGTARIGGLRTRMWHFLLHHTIPRDTMVPALPTLQRVSQVVLVIKQKSCEEDE